jgi:hypothetical protein
MAKAPISMQIVINWLLRSLIGLTKARRWSKAIIPANDRRALTRRAGRWCVILGLLIVHLLVKHAEHHAVIVLD